MEPAVKLAYEFSDGQKLRYRWTVTATTSLETPSEQTRDQLDAALDITQEVLGHTEQNAQVRLTISPRDLIENGVRVETPPSTTLDLELTPEGSVARVVRSAELSPAALIELELEGILREVLPPLAERAVEIGESWSAAMVSDTGRTKLDLKGSARLSSFRLHDRRRLAKIQVERRGRITTSQRVGRADVLLPGTSRSRLTAEIDLDGGFLVSSSARSVADFDIAAGGVRPAGLFDLVIETRAELVEGP